MLYEVVILFYLSETTMTFVDESGHCSFIFKKLFYFYDKLSTLVPEFVFCEALVGTRNISMSPL